MADRESSDWIADRLSSARADAERIAHELLRDGRITADEVGTLAAAVNEAVERARALIGDALREPRRILADLRQPPSVAAARADEAAATPTTETASARIARLEARIAALEEALLRGTHRTRRGSEGD